MRYINIGKKLYPKFINADNIVAVIPYDRAEIIRQKLNLQGINKGNWRVPSHSVVITHSSYGYDMYESTFYAKDLCKLLKSFL